MGFWVSHECASAALLGLWASGCTPRVNFACLVEPRVFAPTARRPVSEQESFIRKSRVIVVTLALSLAFVGGDAVIAAPTPTDIPGAQASQPTTGSGGVPLTPVPTAVAAPAGTAAATMAPLPFGSRSPQVAQLQHRLRARGIKIPITGKFDVRTRAGVRILQRKLGLPATGSPDVALLQQIGVKVRGIASTPGVPVVLPDPTPNAAAIPIALSLQGIPYRYGGSTPASGFDCSGFVSYVYAQIGKSVPHFTGDIWAKFPRVPFEQLAPGDLILSEGLGHVGMYIGNGQYIHSPQTGDVVKISSLASRMGSYLGAVRP